MSWRDDPDTIWEERLGRLRVESDPATGLDLVSIEDRYGSAAFWKPESLADRVEATERWLAAMGLTADNIRERPRPIAAGDLVELGDGPALMRVVHVDGGTAMLRRVDDDYPLVAGVRELVHVKGGAV